MSDSTAQKKYCLGCSYPLMIESAGHCPECGRSVDLQNPRTFSDRPLQGLRMLARIAAILPHLWLWGVAALVIYWSVRFALAPSWVAGWVILLGVPVYALIGLTCCLRMVARLRLIKVAHLIVLLLPILLIVTTWLTQWPARLHFLMVRGELNQIADQVQQSGRTVRNVRFGVWSAWSIEKRNDTTVLVRLEGEGTLMRAPATEKRPWGNIIHEFPLDDEWRAMIDD